MNKQDRAQLNDIYGRLEGLRDEMVDLQEREQEKFDNMTEGLQWTEKGQAIEEAAGHLDTIACYMQDALEGMEELI